MIRIGRGTTLQAGVSIAYATLDYLLKHIKCRTLFATHYHELADMLADRAVREREQERAEVLQAKDLCEITQGLENSGNADTTEGVDAQQSADRNEVGRSRERRTGIERGDGGGNYGGVEFWCTDVDESVRNPFVCFSIYLFVEGARAINLS